MASAANQSGPPYENMFNGMAYVSSQKMNQDTMAGMPSHGARGMQLNYLQKQAGESTSVVTRSPSFQSPNSCVLQSGVSGFEFSGQGSIELQQFNPHSSIPVGFHELPSSGIAHLTVEGESAQGRQTPGSNNIHEASSFSQSDRYNCNPVAEIDNQYNQDFPQQDGRDGKKI